MEKKTTNLNLDKDGHKLRNLKKSMNNEGDKKTVKIDPHNCPLDSFRVTEQLWPIRAYRNIIRLS